MENLHRQGSMSKRLRPRRRRSLGSARLSLYGVLLLGAISLVLIWLVVMVLNVHFESDITQQQFLTSRSFQMTKTVITEEEIVENIHKLIERRVPEVFRDLFEIHLTKKKYKRDFFSWRRLNEDTFELVGTSASALAMGVNMFCRRNLGISIASWATSRIPILPPNMYRENVLANIKEPNNNFTSVVKWRYDFNQVTWSYSQVWWGWDRWERELDWMALKGVNVALAHVGQEAIWKRVYQRLLKGNFDSGRYFTGEVYLSWHRMGNLQKLMGPPSAFWLKNQLNLQHRILERMKDLGITPILPAFNGHVPQQLVDEVNGIEAEKADFWSGFTDPQLTAVNRLKPGSKFFKEIGEAIVIEQLREYSPYLSHLPQRLYSIDTFNEMNPGNSDVSAVSKLLFTSVLSADPDATIVMQMWCFAHNPLVWTKDMVVKVLDGIPASRLILLDLHGEKRPQWRRLRELFQTRPGVEIIWTLLHNFGATGGMAGEMKIIAKEALSAVGDGKVAGLGIAMEGIEQNEILYDMIFRLAWKEEGEKSFDLSLWIDQWVTARYGESKRKQTLVNAWKCARKTVYDRSPDLSGWGFKSIIGERPIFSMRTNEFQSTDISYRPSQFLRCVEELLSAADETSHRLPIKSSAMSSLLYDVVDFVRQLASDIMLVLHEKIVKAYLNKNVEQFKYGSNTFTMLLTQLDKLLMSHPNWRLATIALPTREVSEHDFSRHCMQAATLITQWHPASRVLHSYSSRQLGGILGTLYLKRWKLWFKTLEENMFSKRAIPSLRQDYSRIEDNWIQHVSSFAVSSDARAKLVPLEVFTNAYSVMYIIKDLIITLYE